MISRLSLVLIAFLCAAAAAEPSKPIVLPPEEGAKEGKALTGRMTSMQPDKNSVTTGTLTIRRPRMPEATVPVRFEIQAGDSKWVSIYEAPQATNAISLLRVSHAESQPNRYRIIQNGLEKQIAATETMVPFAGSDFWVADLGLEFLFWPEQRVLRKEIRRGQSCSVLESRNPNPAPGAYARVLSWVDIDTGGIINADAYGKDGKQMKQFVAQRFKKVQGQWEVKQIEMNDSRTGSRTTLTFDLGEK